MSYSSILKEGSKSINKPEAGRGPFGERAVRGGAPGASRHPHCAPGLRCRHVWLRLSLRQAGYTPFLPLWSSSPGTWMLTPSFQWALGFLLSLPESM